MAFNLSNKASFQDFRNFINKFDPEELVFRTLPNEVTKGVPNAMARTGKVGLYTEKPTITFTESLFSSPFKPIEAQSIFLHEVGHLVSPKGLVTAIPGSPAFKEASHISEFLADSHAASMLGTVKPLKSGLRKLSRYLPEMQADTETHPSLTKRLANLDELQEVIKEVGRDKSIPAKLKGLSKEDRILTRKLIPFEVFSARKGFTLDLPGTTLPTIANPLTRRSLLDFFDISASHREMKDLGKSLFEELLKGEDSSPPSWQFEVSNEANIKRKIAGDYEYYLYKTKNVKENFEKTRRANNPSAGKTLAKKAGTDDSIDSAVERAIQRVKNSKGLYSLPAAEGSAQSDFLAKIAMNTPTSPTEHGIAKAVEIAGSRSRLLRAASEASAAVASGTGGSRALRAAGAALNILKSRI